MVSYPISVEGVAEDKLPVGVPMYWAVNTPKDDATKAAAKDFLNYVYTWLGKDYVINKFKFIPAYKGFDTSKISILYQKIFINMLKQEKLLTGYSWDILQAGDKNF